MKRDIAIDYLRSSVIVLVVAHHAALAYNTFSHYDPGHYMKSTAPVVDTIRWMPLDWLVGWNDMFFMSLMFLVSGLFVAPSIERKGVGHFLADRTKRLGIPFVIAVTLLSPLAYYPSWLSSDAVNQGGFLRRFFTAGDWSGGPAWFIWVLLAFCGVVAVAYQLIPNLMKKLSWSAASARSLVVMFLTVSLLTTVPLRLFILPTAWSRLAGPLVFQTWKLLLYFAWFLLGVALGGANLELSLSRHNLRPWPLWLVLGGLTYVVHGLLELSGACFVNTPVWVANVILATVYSFCCTFTGLAALGMARSFFRTARPLADNFTENAYGIYIFHYGFVTWIQFYLLTKSLPAALKFLITFSVALTASWFLTAMLRKTVAGKVL
ncbi:MAG: acyltransferase family protein [Proteobacteria bacterium]|nr:acyltransferase family protein [Pseudomonadota bacterium]